MLVTGRCADYIATMAHAHTTTKPVRVSRLEGKAARRDRMAREAELLAQARASAAAGGVVSEEQVDAWIDSLGTEHELPPPRSSR